MSGSLGEAVLDLAADSAGLIGDINSARPKALGALSDLGRVGGLLLAAGITAAAAAVVGITALVWNSANTLDAAYDTIQTRTGATGEELELLKEDFKEVFTSVPANAEDAAYAIGELNTRLGLTGPMLQDTSAQLLEMVRITGGDLAANTEAFTRLIGDWGVPLDEAALSLDKVFVASQNTGIGTDRLMQLMVQFGAPMRQFGFSFEESAALLGKWEKEGVNTELVMGSLRIAAGEFARANVPLRDGLQDTFEAIKNAEDESSALAIAMDVFGARAGPDMAAAIREGRFELGDLVEMLGDSEGAIMDNAEATMDWGERLQMFKNRVTTAFEPAGQKLMDVASGLLDTLAEIFERDDVQKGIEQIGVFVGDLADGIAENVPRMINGFFKFVQWLKDNKPIVVGILAALGVAILAFGISVAIAAWTAMAPLLPVIAIMALVGLAAYLLYRAWTENWGGIREKAAAAWAVIGPILQTILNWLQVNIPLAIQALSGWWSETLLPAIQSAIGTAQILIGGFMEFFEALTSGKLGRVSEIWKNTLDSIKIWLDATLINLKLIYKAFTQAMQGDWYGFGQSLGKIWANTWAALGKILEIGWANMQDIFLGLIEWIFELFTETDWGQVGESIIEGLANGITNAAGWLYDALAELVQNMISIILGLISGAGDPSLTPPSVGDTLKALAGLTIPAPALGFGGSAAFSALGAIPALGASGGIGGVTNTFYAPVTFEVKDKKSFDELMRTLRKS